MIFGMNSKMAIAVLLVIIMEFWFINRSVFAFWGNESEIVSERQLVNNGQTNVEKHVTNMHPSYLKYVKEASAGARFSTEISFVMPDRYIYKGKDLSPFGSVLGLRPLKRLWSKRLQQRIFFLDTSERGSLNVFQSCAVESAARANSQWKVKVFFRVKPNNDTILKKLKRDSGISNIKFSQILIQRMSKGTVLENLISKNTRLHNNTDVLRLLILFRFGGVFLDSNSVVIRQFKALKHNWAVRMNNSLVSSVPIAMSDDNVGRGFSKFALRFLKLNIYSSANDSELNDIGNKVITETLKYICSTPDVYYMDADSCHGIEILNTNYFPMTRKDMRLVFTSEYILLRNSFLLHLKDPNFIQLYNIYYPKLARKYCPTTLEVYGASSFEQEDLEGNDDSDDPEDLTTTEAIMSREDNTYLRHLNLT